MLTISPDGYIRLSPAELPALALRHLISGLDEDEPAMASLAAPTCITGYTEWLSEGAPVITIGWDWQMLGTDGATTVVRVGSPRSNVLMLAPDGSDCTVADSLQQLDEFVDQFDWTGAVIQHIGDRYKA